MFRGQKPSVAVARGAKENTVLARRAAVLAAGLALAGTALAAPAAQAGPAGSAGTDAGVTSSPAKVARAVDGQWYCNYVSSNRLCVRYINNKASVDVKYEKNEGDPIYARFSYHDYTFNSDHWDGGQFRQVKNTTRSYAWYNVWPGCVRGFLNVSGGSQYASPQICP